MYASYMQTLLVPFKGLFVMTMQTMVFRHASTISRWYPWFSRSGLQPLSAFSQFRNKKAKAKKEKGNNERRRQGKRKMKVENEGRTSSVDASQKKKKIACNDALDPNPARGDEHSHLLIGGFVLRLVTGEGGGWARTFGVKKAKANNKLGRIVETRHECLWIIEKSWMLLLSALN